MKRDEIERLLPLIFQRTLRPGTVLHALLQVMDDLHAPAEAVLTDIETTFDPRRTTDAFVPFLAHWVGLERIFDERREGVAANSSPYVPITAGLGPLRELIATATHLSQWRGTEKGLRLFLEMATGVSGFEIDEHVTDGDGETRQFHIHVWVPEAARPHRPLIERIIAQEKPAHITYTLDFRSRPVGEK